MVILIVFFHENTYITLTILIKFCCCWCAFYVGAAEQYAATLGFKAVSRLQMGRNRHRHTDSTDDELQGRARKKDDLENQRKLRNFAVRLLLILLFAAASLTVLFIPTSLHNEHELRSADDHPKSWSLERLYQEPKNEEVDDHPFCRDDSIINCLRNSITVRKLQEKKSQEGLRIGLLNFRKSQALLWQKFATPNYLDMKNVGKNVSWSRLYPEWIDEEEQWHTPKCPVIPMPILEEGARFDLVVARVECNRSAGNWTRDVSRLQVFLAAAHAAAADLSNRHMYVALCDSCRPPPNLFTCNELVEHQDGLWLYKVHLKKLRKKLSLPVGSCQLAVPLKSSGKLYHVKQKNAAREAYVTILHSAQLYVCGAIALAQSIRMSGSKRDLVILVDKTIHPDHREGLEMAGWKVVEIVRIRNPKAEPESYNEWNYSKFRLWQLTHYTKLIFIDADVIVLQNLDFLFDMPEITATGNHESLFNSGVMVLEPSNCTFDLLMEEIEEVESYNGGDQGYLNEIFTWWHRLPKHMNFLKHFGFNDSDEVQHRIDLFTAEPPAVFAMHFLGLKPWLCFRDYDCNWNQRKLHEYANDAVHEKWWRVHDSMPKKLQSYCLLRSKQKASLEWDRRQAEAEKFEDGHWKLKIKDPRLKICFEEFCYWESMLWHWGESGSDGNDTIVANATSSGRR